MNKMCFVFCMKAFSNVVLLSLIGVLLVITLSVMTIKIPQIEDMEFENKGNYDYRLSSL